MYCRYLLALAITATIFSPSFVSLSSAEEVLTEQRFHQLHKQLQPAADELWRTIPWRTSLLEAQQLAITEKKPIFIWAMDGHPLGCT
ncbi:MAG: hypothetical protein ACKVK0_11830 [Pirellulales bacterium]|jgi:hypothetical protein|tara:strand:+ start:835 stop:1095 length:261 start_codon:yes stop_codon:yes gene_type:complete